MNFARRKKYRAMTIPYLKRFRDELSALINELELGPRREIDIGANHVGDRELIHAVLETRGDKQSGRCRELQRIYCSTSRCPQCPHGPFWYRYRVNKRKKAIDVIYEGMLVFDYEAIKAMDIKPPAFVGTIEKAMKWNDVEAKTDSTQVGEGDKKERN